MTDSHVKAPNAAPPLPQRRPFPGGPTCPQDPLPLPRTRIVHPATRSRNHVTHVDPSDRPHALYRFYNADGHLLYVGITLNPAHRWPDHRKHKPWWTDITRITLETHPNRAAVLDAERAAIIAERPRHNVVHNGQPLTDDDLDPTFGATADTMPDECAQCLHAGHPAAYYPFRWITGHARYVCARGHYWTCWWGHDHSGDDRARAGHPIEVSP